MLTAIVTLEALEAFTVEEDGHVTMWQQGEQRTLSFRKARQVASRVGRKKVRMLDGYLQDAGVEKDVTNIQRGDLIAWKRANGLDDIGEVECLHIDDNGITWAFVDTGETWAVVNLQYAQWIDQDA
jgi:hypothetical protein